MAYPDLGDYLLAEARHGIDVLVDHIVSYDVKRRRLDSSSTVSKVGVGQRRETTAYLVSCLAKTRLRKLAGLHSSHATVEATAQGSITCVKEALSLTCRASLARPKPYSG